jgi:hypothetical protein
MKRNLVKSILQLRADVFLPNALALATGRRKRQAISLASAKFKRNDHVAHDPP